MADLHRPRFPDDDGSADPALAEMLRGRAAGEVDDRAVHAALRPARLLVPVLASAVETEVGADGAVREKTSEMATVTLAGRDGRQALPVFTSVATLSAWRADARPVAVAASEAARSAIAEGADALVVDVAGPVVHTVAGSALRALAEDRPYLPPYDDEEVRTAVVDTLRGLGLTARLEPGGEGTDLLVVLVGATPGDVERAAAALGEVVVLRTRLETGLAIAVEPPPRHAGPR